ncbi:hypothetical protein CJF31_00006623 [Rutstroemia sp. NJR-2017a BVV2]|nr:hypothetical protein CJF31_00006623 [Rutstroemia sp. NJR-2017a BVV2]
MRTKIVSPLAIATLFGTVNAWADSAVHETLLPNVRPTKTHDPWQCVTEDLTEYFDVPKPVGSLLDALNSYADKLIEPCTLPQSIWMFPSKGDWCNFTTAAPASVLPDYELYGSAASAWWAAHSSSAVQLARECPNGWYNAMLELPGGGTWLNDTIIFAACHTEVVTTTTASSASQSSGFASTKASATTLPGAISIPTASVTPVSTNGVASRGEDLEMWIMAGTGFVAAAGVSL